MGGQSPSSVRLSPGLWKVLKRWYADTSTPSLYGFQMCVSLWMCASLPSCWVQSSMVLRARDLSRSNSAGLISYTHKQITKSCFSCRAEPPLVFTGPD